MDYDVESIITEIKETKREMKKIIKRVVVVAFLVYAVIVSLALFLNISELSVQVTPLFGMLIFFPLITFFLGMSIVWRKKFETLEKDNTKQSPVEQTVEQPQT